MEINLRNAVNKFYPNPTLEMVFFEAIANSIDAGANNIKIDIALNAMNEPESLGIIIEDDGKGFTDENFKKFGTLLEFQDKYHKGLGRLVYLQYFKNIYIESYFGKKQRKFTFNDTFRKKSELKDIDFPRQGTILQFEDYYRGSIRSYAYVIPKHLIESTKLHFYPTLYSRKFSQRKLIIEFNLTVKIPNPKADFINSSEKIDTSTLPELKSYKLEKDKIDLFSDVILHYQIERTFKKTSVITAINVDGRTVSLDILSEDEIPQGYEMFFLLTSSYFDGKASTTREYIEIDKSVLDKIKTLYKISLRDIFNQEVPEIRTKNEKVVKSIKKVHPYLNGYVVDSAIGLAKKEKVLEDAHKKFFEDQKRILEAENLNDQQYEEALKLSSRILAEYIIYRQKIIDKLKTIDINNSETEIHEIIVPTKTILNGERFVEDVYRNNIWLLDDKFMTYSTILSELEMNKLIPYIRLDEESDDDTRPDIAIVFSKDPIRTEKLVDVVIVELKKLGLKLAKREEVVSQLKQRARKLLQYYPNEIGRIWFYGIVDIDKEFRISLKESGFKPIYSEDQVFYQETKIIVDEDKNIEIPIGLNIMSYDALMLDADARNSTFLKILIDGINSFSENTQSIAVTTDIS